MLPVGLAGAANLVLAAPPSVRSTRRRRLHAADRRGALAVRAGRHPARSQCGAVRRGAQDVRRARPGRRPVAGRRGGAPARRALHRSGRRRWRTGPDARRAHAGGRCGAGRGGPGGGGPRRGGGDPILGDGRRGHRRHGRHRGAVGCHRRVRRSGGGPGHPLPADVAGAGPAPGHRRGARRDRSRRIDQRRAADLARTAGRRRCRAARRRWRSVACSRRSWCRRRPCSCGPAAPPRVAPRAASAARHHGRSGTSRSWPTTPVDRAALLAELDGDAAVGRAGVAAAGCGRGRGLGTTTAMIEFAHRHRDRYDIAWWIPAARSRPGPGPDGRARGGPRPGHGRRLGEPGGRDAARGAARRRRWLLVFDDAGGPRELARVPAGRTRRRPDRVVRRGVAASSPAR